MARPRRQGACKAPHSASAASSSSASKWTAPSILVASTLIINAFDSCQAAPRPIPTDQVYQRRTQKQTARGFADVDDKLSSPWMQRDEMEKRAHEAARGLYDTPSSVHLIKRNATRTLAPSGHTYAVATGTGKSIVVPSAFASNIASSWDPRQRSIWFQRKAVIITSVFLAILIVLIIGAAAFVRDKREADSEGEIDTSDEAALKRMKEERDMRNGGKKGKRKKVEIVDDKASIRTADRATTTGIALRWAKVPVRRLRKKSGRTSSTRSSVSDRSIANDQDSPTSRQSSALVTASTSNDETTSSDAHAVQEADTSQGNSIQTSTDTSSGQRTSSSRDPLSVADMSAAEAELERHLHGSQHDEEADAFPPAYISRNREGLHPSADRRLAAGSSTDAVASSRSEEKRPMLSRSADTGEGDDSILLPSVADGPSAAGAQDHYSGHVATDDKTLLGQIHNAASAPSAPATQGQASDMETSNDSSVTTSLQPSSQASAPILDMASATGDDLTEEELNTIQNTEKGKATSSLLPAPPRPLSSSNFSRFDMPYVMENVVAMSPSRSSDRATSKSISEKEQEAEDERRRTIALIESKPEDLVHLPRYEKAQHVASTPSAPAEYLHEMDAPSSSPTSSAPSAPSAPPAEE